MMDAAPSFILITPTWSGDLEHFRLLRASIERSGLRDIPHATVVQAEDRHAFSGFEGGSLTMLSTADVLPAALEQRRLKARAYERLFGRHVTRIAGSLSRKIGVPSWPHYTGWHTQQICKLKLAAESECDYAVVIDSDVVVCPDATPAELLPAGSAIACYATWGSPESLISKVRNWVNQASLLVHAKPEHNGRINDYFDTPFIIHVPTLRALFEWLESEHGEPWWSVLLKQPPRRWSEFATYKAFLARRQTEYGQNVVWADTGHIRYIFDTSDAERLSHEVALCFKDPSIKFVTIHSQSTGRKLWSVEDWSGQLMNLITTQDGLND
ncbi:DUF6492 family protein [Marinobacter sediminicola]|uniref:DUF6492 family protein n=1 Tax=Marinobacter sediminicola TaxID=3072994 RepID=UPI002811CA9D|nr:DUF6492 family protein [Marinobacter sp. F26243]